MNRAIHAYRHTTLFYFLATVVPWSFWGLAAAISHADDYAHAGELASLFAFAGLLAPTLVAFALIYRDPRLRGDVLRRLAVPRARPVIHCTSSRHSTAPPAISARTLGELPALTEALTNGSAENK